MSHKLIPLVTMSVLLLASPLLAQSSRGSVRGRVTDQAGAPLARASVRAARSDTGESRSVATDEAGRFSLPELEVGEYRFAVELTGYGTYTRQAQLAVGQDLWLDIPLAIAVQQDVDVVAPFVPIDRDSAALGTLIDPKQVAGLPLDGRNFLELALLTPGTVPAPQGSAASVRGDFAFSVNGGREDANGYLLDGVYNMDPKLGTSGVRPAVDAIYEFGVETSTYDASFGRNAAGQINVVTRAGSNRYSGTAYEFFRNGGLDSRNAFAPRDRAGAGLQQAPVRRIARRPPRGRPSLLFRRLREHEGPRRDHARHQRPDARRATGRLFAVALRAASRSLLGAAVSGQSHSRRSS